MKAVKFLLNVILIISLLINSAGQGYALRPMATSLGDKLPSGYEYKINRAIAEAIIYWFKYLALKADRSYSPLALGDLAIELKKLGYDRMAEYALERAFERAERNNLYGFGADSMAILALVSYELSKDKEKALAVLGDTYKLLDNVSTSGWKEVADGYIALGYPEKAREILLELADIAYKFDEGEGKEEPIEKWSPLKDAVGGLARAGYLEEAERMIEKLREQIHKDMAFEDLIRNLPKTASAEPFIEKLRTRKFAGNPSRSTAIGLVFKAMIREGEADIVFSKDNKDLIQFLKKEYPYYVTCLYLEHINRLLESNELEKAEQLVAKLDENINKIKVLSLISTKYAESGRLEKAQSLLDEALSIYDRTGRYEYEQGQDFYRNRGNIECPIYLARPLRRLGHTEEAESLLSRAYRDFNEEAKGERMFWPEDYIYELIESGCISDLYEAIRYIKLAPLAGWKVMAKIFSAFVQQIPNGSLDRAMIEDAFKYVKSGLPYRRDFIDEYFTAKDKDAYIRRIEKEALSVIEKGFDPKAERSRFLAFFGLGFKGVVITEDDYERMIKGLMVLAGEREPYFRSLFDKKGYPSFRITRKEGLSEDISDVDDNKVREHAKLLISMHRDTLNLADMDEDFRKKVYAYCKFKDEFDKDADMRKRIGAIKPKHLKEYLTDPRHAGEITGENIFKFLVDMKDKHLLVNGIYFVAFNQYIGSRNEKFLNLMFRSLVTDSLLDENLREVIGGRADILKQMKAIRQIYTDRKYHLPERLDMPLHKRLEVKFEEFSRVIEEEMAKVKLKKVVYDKEMVYDFIPSRFLGVFGGLIGDDCTADDKKKYPYARAMHEDTMYYIVLTNERPTGYIALLEGSSDEKNVLTIDTLQPVPSQIVAEALEKLHNIALNKRFIGIALPSSKKARPKDKRSPLEESFNYPEVIEAVAELKGYKNGTPITAEPIHKESWKLFNETYGVHPNFAIENKRFVLYKPEKDTAKSSSAGSSKLPQAIKGDLSIYRPKLEHKARQKVEKIRKLLMQIDTLLKRKNLTLQANLMDVIHGAKYIDTIDWHKSEILKSADVVTLELPDASVRPWRLEEGVSKINSVFWHDCLVNLHFMKLSDSTFGVNVADIRYYINRSLIYMGMILLPEKEEPTHILLDESNLYNTKELGDSVERYITYGELLKEILSDQQREELKDKKMVYVEAKDNPLGNKYLLLYYPPDEEFLRLADDLADIFRDLFDRYNIKSSAQISFIVINFLTNLLVIQNDFRQMEMALDRIKQKIRVMESSNGIRAKTLNYVHIGGAFHGYSLEKYWGFVKSRRINIRRCIDSRMPLRGYMTESHAFDGELKELLSLIWYDAKKKRVVFDRKKIYEYVKNIVSKNLEDYRRMFIAEFRSVMAQELALKVKSKDEPDENESTDEGFSAFYINNLWDYLMYLIPYDVLMRFFDRDSGMRHEELLAYLFLYPKPYKFLLSRESIDLSAYFPKEAIAYYRFCDIHNPPRGEPFYIKPRIYAPGEVAKVSNEALAKRNAEAAIETAA